LRNIKTQNYEFFQILEHLPLIRNTFFLCVSTGRLSKRRLRSPLTKSVCPLGLPLPDCLVGEHPRHGSGTSWPDCAVAAYRAVSKDDREHDVGRHLDSAHHRSGASVESRQTVPPPIPLAALHRLAVPLRGKCCAYWGQGRRTTELTGCRAAVSLWVTFRRSPPEQARSSQSQGGQQ
jgi:hypothetical protein